MGMEEALYTVAEDDQCRQPSLQTATIANCKRATEGYGHNRQVGVHTGQLGDKIGQPIDRIACLGREIHKSVKPRPRFFESLV